MTDLILFLYIMLFSTKMFYFGCVDVKQVGKKENNRKNTEMTVGRKCLHTTVRMQGFSMENDNIKNIFVTFYLQILFKKQYLKNILGPALSHVNYKTTQSFKL